MRTAQPSERAIYIPKGRRELIQSTGGTSATPTRRPKRRMEEPSETQNKAPRVVPFGADPRNFSTTPSVAPETKPEPKPEPKPEANKPASKFATASIYIPKAKREQMERDAAKEAATAKQKTDTTTKANDNIPLPAPVKRQTSNDNPPVTKASATTTSTTTTTTSTTSDTDIADTSPITNTTSTAIKPKEAVRGGIYVPKGRRELNDKTPAAFLTYSTNTNSSSTSGAHTNNTAKTTTTANSAITSVPRIPRVSDDDSPGKGNTSSSNTNTNTSSGNAKSKTYSSWDDSSDEDSSYSNYNNLNINSNTTNSTTTTTTTTTTSATTTDDTIERSTLIITVPSDLTDPARSNIIRPYQDKGATSRWHSDTQCLLMYKTERLASTSIPPAGCSIFRVVRLKDVSGAQKEELLAACREAYPSSKPERDSTVANRLIGAALGIRLPKPVSSTSGGSGSGGGRRAPSPVREDAWD